jgi:hypothetical protein
VGIPADQHELYAEYGMVAEKAQVLEVAAGNVALGFLMVFVKTDEITPEQTEMYRAIVDDVNRKTFGSLLNHLKKTMNLSDRLLRSLMRRLSAETTLPIISFAVTTSHCIAKKEGRQ